MIETFIMKTDNLSEMGTRTISTFPEADILLPTTLNERKAGSPLSDTAADFVENKQTKKMRNAGSRMMTYLLIAIDIFLVVLVIVTAVFMSREKDNYRTDSKLCVLCNDVQLHPYVTMDEFKFSKNNTLCCLKDAKNLGTLVEKFTEHWYKEKMAEESPRFSLCPKGSTRNHSWLKVQGVLRRKGTSTLGRHRLLRWNHHPNPIGSNGDLTYSDGYITIHDSGVYHIYSQLTRDRFTSKKARLLTHRVVLARKGYEEHERVIIDSTRSECKRNGTITYDTSYVGTVYQLTKGDMIAVRVDNEDEIVNGHRQNFFGVIRM